MRLAEQQMAFAAHLRDPERVPAPAGVEPHRMAICRELFFANVAGLLAGSFPVVRRILGTAGWNRLAREFYATHHAHTPYFLELPREFVEWLRAREERPADEPAFLDELAHYEWVELALAISEEALPVAGAEPDADPFDSTLAVSPLAWVLAYRWPVHRLAPDFQPAEPPAEATFLVVYRDDTDTVKFLEIGAQMAALLEVLEHRPGLTGRQALERSMTGADVDAIGAARTALLDLLRRGVLTFTDNE
jgi:hypothetical protein